MQVYITLIFLNFYKTARLGWKILGKVQRKGNLMTGEYEQVIICIHENTAMKNIHSKMGEGEGW
jgi:hypothetical protein